MTRGGGKFERYRSLSSLKDYLLVAQEKCHVVHYTRQSNHTWLLSETHDVGDHLSIASIGCDLVLSEIYAKVSLDS